MKRLLVIIGFILGMSLAGVVEVEAQSIRSRQTHRVYRGHTVYKHQNYRPHYRYPPYHHSGFRINIGYGTGYYGVGGYYSFYNPYSGPRFVHYPPRAPVVVLPPIEQVVPAPALPATVVTLKPGETIQRGNIVIANIDGKLVIFQAEKE